VRIVLAVLLFLLQSAVPVQAVQLTSDAAEADFADVRSDAAGNIHLVYTANDVDDGRALFYRMLRSDGTVLIDTTRIDTAGNGPAAYPSIVMDAASQVYVVWQAGVSPEIYFTRLDPLQDDRDGSAADPAFKEIADTIISGAGGDNAVHPRVALDAGLQLHVVWENKCAGPVQYTRVTFDADGLPLVGAAVPLGGTGSCNDLPDVALDSNGDVHVVFANAAGTTADEIWYAMLSGTTGDILIDATLLTADEGLRAGSATLGVNPFDNRVFVVFKEETGSGGDGSEHIFLSVLDPALIVDKNGSSADLAILQVDHQQLALGSGDFRWQVFARIGSDRRLHVLYTDVDYSDVDAETCPAGPYTIQHAHVIYDGRVLVRKQQTSTATALRNGLPGCAIQARLVPNGNRLVWTDSASGEQEIHSVTFVRADAGSSGFTCSLGGAGTGMAQAGDAWVLLVVIAGLGSLCRRRRRA